MDWGQTMVSLNRRLTEREANVLEARLVAAKHPSERVTILLGLVREQEKLTEFNASRSEIHKAFYEVSRKHPDVFEGFGFDTRSWRGPWSEPLEHALAGHWLFSGKVWFDMLSDQVKLNPGLWPEAESLLAVKYDTRAEEDGFRAAAHELAALLKPRN